MISLTARPGPDFSRAVLPPIKKGPLGEGLPLSFKIQNFIQELTAPLSLGSFGAGIALGRLATAGFLARSTRWTGVTFLGSQAAGLAGEITGMTLSRRLGAQVFLGASNPWNPGEVAHEMLLMAAPFALLRGSQLLLAKMGPLPASSWISSARLGADVSAVMAGHGVNGLIDPENHRPGDPPLWYAALLTVAHMRLAGHILAPLASPTLDRVIGAREHRLRTPSDLQHPEGPGLPLALSRWAPAEGPRLQGPGKTSLPNASQVRMMGGNPEGSTKPKAAESSPPPSSDRGEAIEAELESRMRELQKEASKYPVGEKLEGVAERLQGLLDRFLSGEHVRPSDFEHDLVEIEGEINRVKDKKNRLGEIIKNTLVFLDQVRTPETGKEPSSPKAAMVPEDVSEAGQPWVGGVVGGLALSIRDGVKGIVNRFLGRVSNPQPKSPSAPEGTKLNETEEKIRAIRQKLNAKAVQGTRLQEVLRNLELLRRYLLVANRRGLEGRVLWSLNANIAKLKESFPGLKWKTIPWSQAAGELAARRNGAILGLGMRTAEMEFDTTLARRLRGESTEDGREIKLDRELEVIQQSLLLGAGWQGSPRKMRPHLDRMISDYGVGNHAEVTTRLAAEATYQMVMGKLSKDRLLDFLLSKTSGGPLENAVKGLSTVLKVPGSDVDSLGFLTREAASENLLLSSLGLLLRSGGETEVFARELRRLEQLGGPGFHPSLALTFFGAAHGQENLPADFLPKDFDQENYLRRAQEEFLREFSDPS